MIGSEHYRLLPLPARGLLAGQRVGVSGGFPAGPALLSVEADGPADPGSRTAVVVHEVAEVPPGVLAVGEDLYDELGGSAAGRWSLRAAPVVEASDLVLELPTERDPEQLARQIPHADLADRVIWVPDGEGDLYLDVDGLPCRVLDIGVGPSRQVIGRIGPRTNVEVFAPGVKAGVDIVILADCSGSMTWDDIPVGEPTRPTGTGRGLFRRRTQLPTHLTRQAALQQALFDLLRVRLQAAGRISRMALLGFTTETRAQFPPQGGMVQLDASSPPEVIEQFRSGVATLPADGGTNIGNALHAAADLLHRHGHPKNERLIILVSDGADWHPAGERGTGDLRRGTEEPVSLMAHLHRNMDIRLHAIGISTREMFHRCYPDIHDPSVVPNHGLLTELLQVGGGDPTRIGGRDVLLEYFSGVGAGFAHRVTGPLTSRPVADLDGEARRMLRAAGPAIDHAAALPAATEAYGRVRKDLIAVSRRVFADPLIEPTSFGQADEELRKAVRGSNPARSLRYVAQVLTPEEGVGNQLSSIRAWRALLDGVSGAAGTQSPDLSAVAHACGAAGTEPAELVVALVRRLTAALADVVREANTLPACQQDAGPPLPGTPAAPRRRPRRGGDTAGVGERSRSRSSLTVKN